MKLYIDVQAQCYLTPNAPEQLFDRIEHEPETTCLYKRLFLDYTYGLNRIYTEDEISAAKQSPSFEREYNLKYLGLIGNVFHTRSHIIGSPNDEFQRLFMQKQN
ncbi:MAG: hypothetical protein WA941_10600 [Nitrososphaeraceae archaeon]